MHFPRLIVALNFLLFSGLVANAQHICGAPPFLRARTESEQLEERALTRDERAAQLQKRNGCNDDNVLWALQRFSASATPFCEVYITVPTPVLTIHVGRAIQTTCVQQSVKRRSCAIELSQGWC